jgi:hypothetical protein
VNKYKIRYSPFPDSDTVVYTYMYARDAEEALKSFLRCHMNEKFFVKDVALWA